MLHFNKILDWGADDPKNGSNRLSHNRQWELPRLTFAGYQQPQNQKPRSRHAWLRHRRLMFTREQKSLAIRSKDKRHSHHLNHRRSVSTLRTGILKTRYRRRPTTRDNLRIRRLLSTPHKGELNLAVNPLKTKHLSIRRTENRADKSWRLAR